MADIHPRIHVLLAGRAPVGVVIRRGPSKSVCTLSWDRRDDTFRPGQWLKGRIYERRCDLSPDGRYFIYFAMNGKWRTESKGSWTAISGAPFLKALAMFPKGDCWHGGGLFTTEKRYWLNDGYGHEVLRDTKEVRRDAKYHPARFFGGECLGVYYPRLLRDGWKLVERIGLAWEGQDIFEKPADGGWTLRKIAHSGTENPVGTGCYWDEHELIGGMPSRTVACPGWEWADVDGARLVWAAEGKIFAAQLGESGLVDATELLDTNGMAFEPIEAPY